MRLRATSFLFFAIVLTPVLANAEPPARGPRTPPLVKAKAITAPVATPVGLAIVETVKDPAVDYDAEVYSGVPLTDAYAKERGLTKGLVRMVFEKERRKGFKIAHEKIKRVVRLAAGDAADTTVTKHGPFMPIVAQRSVPRDRIDIIETDAGVIAIETATTNAGIFTTSDVYVFARGATLEQRLIALAIVEPGTRDRLRAALTLAAK
jgi:hypothetical protein